MRAMEMVLRLFIFVLIIPFVLVAAALYHAGKEFVSGLAWAITGLP